MNMIVVLSLQCYSRYSFEIDLLLCYCYIWSLNNTSYMERLKYVLHNMPSYSIYRQYIYTILCSCAWYTLVHEISPPVPLYAWLIMLNYKYYITIHIRNEKGIIYLDCVNCTHPLPIYKLMISAEICLKAFPYSNPTSNSGMVRWQAFFECSCKFVHIFSKNKQCDAV
jgi:hypothetical protein